MLTAFGKSLIPNHPFCVSRVTPWPGKLEALYAAAVARRSKDAALVALSMATLITVSGACATNRTADQATNYKIATHANGISLLAGLDSTLQGQANDDGTACFWVAYGLGRMALVWPNGYTAKGSPLAIYDERGVRAAVVGSHLTAGGGLLPADFRGQPLGCVGVFRAFWIVDNVLINGEWHPN
jgi:hypothetical protein